MATTYEVIFLGTLPRIDPTQGNEVAENAAGILGSYGTFDNPLSARVQTLSAERLSEDDNDSYDTDNGGGYDSFRINGGAPRDFDAVATYNAVIVYSDGTTATITATVFQDVNGNTFLAPEEVNNADQFALTAKPIMSLNLNSVAANTGDMQADRVAGDFKASVDGTAGHDFMAVGYTDAQGDRITEGNDYIVSGGGNDTVYAGAGEDVINTGDGNDVIDGGSGNDTIYAGAGDDYIADSPDDDLVYAGAGNDTINIGDRQDTVYAGDGADLIITRGSDYDKLVVGGEGGTDDDTLSWATEADAADAVNVVFSGNESGTGVIRGHTVTFSEIENIEGTQVNDTIDARASNADLDLRGEGGNDIIIGGAGRDTILGGTGADDLRGGDNQDRFVIQDGFGNDTIDGGAGGVDVDTIDLSQLTVPVVISYTGADSGTISDGTHTITFTEIETLILNDRATFVDGGADTRWMAVVGGSGADTIVAGDGTDTIQGNGGDDVIDGGGGADSLEGGDGSDRFILRDGFGNDTIVGGEGGSDFDVIDLSALTVPVTVTFTGDGAGTLSDGTDTVVFSQIEGFALPDGTLVPAGDKGTTLYLGNGGANAATGGGQADTLIGGAGSDTLNGGDGGDRIRGDDGADFLDGGDGEDTLAGGRGDDVLTGGAGNDVFLYAPGDGADTIIDFGGGILNDGDSSNNDSIDLSAFYDDMGELRADFADDGILNQSNATDGGGDAVDYSDNAQFGPGGSLKFQGADQSSFSTDNTGVACFTTGTLILTPSGAVPIERLRPGDLVITRDNGPQPLLWRGLRRLRAPDLIRMPHLRPIEIKAGALGAHDALVVSPQHGILLARGPDEIMVRAKHLAEVRGGAVRIRAGCRGVTYCHLLFERHQVIFSNGLPSESFFPGPQAVQGLDRAALHEIVQLFPALAGQIDKSLVLRTYGQTARRFLKRADLPDLAVWSSRRHGVGRHRRSAVSICPSGA